MKPLGLNEIRERYLKFFENHDHLRMESFPLVPQGDSSLLLINSGMAPLKPYFSGEVTPPHPRMTTCQKCIRTPDIERVGKTSRHGTYFEMLGNFSFGDYFKREAAKMAWDFCIKDMEMDPALLHVSVYLDDDEAYDIWTKEVGVDPSHMVRLGKADNFWEIGSGPCGPCSEIYFDRGAENGCGSPDCKVGCDCDRYVEFWNLVFTQFHNDGAGNYSPLKQKNIDTGMGLERLACISQNVDNLFEVDTIRRIREHVSGLAGIEYKKDEKADVSLRVVTDHIRSTTMLVCDGVLPSNEGRGYVLRRLLRRAARHGKLLGIDRPFLFEVCGTVINESKAAYPELEEKREYITRVIAMEEERFSQTIVAGLSLLREGIDALKAAGSGIFGGDEAFKLYDTYGFPIDLTLEILDENRLTLARDAFDSLMAKQRERARAARKAMGDHGWESVDLGLERDLKTEFTGYTNMTDEGVVWAICTSNGDSASSEISESITEGMEGMIVLNKTPFYAESGGQVADTGTLTGTGGVFQVTDVQKTKDSKYTHTGKVISGSLGVGERVTAEVDRKRRMAIMRAHSATHLLQSALRVVLGSQVEQRGSYVSADSVRFDFTHFTAMSAAELAEVQRIVNENVLEDLSVSVSEMPIAEAKAQGAMALFGEKYGDVVRVVKMGGVSTELCGGTHTANTAKIGCMQLISESSVAAGVRRIEARTGSTVLENAETLRGLVNRVAGMLKTAPNELAGRVEKFIEEQKLAQRKLQQMSISGLQNEAAERLKQKEHTGGLRVLTLKCDGAEADTMREVGDNLRGINPDAVIVMATVKDEKITFTAVCGAEAVKKGIKAGELIREVTKICGGSGGGRPDSATGGGRELDKLDDALAAAEEFVKGKI